MILADADAKTVSCNLISLKIFGTRGPCLLTMWPIFVEFTPLPSCAVFSFFIFKEKHLLKIGKIKA